MTIAVTTTRLHTASTAPQLVEFTTLTRQGLRTLAEHDGLGVSIMVSTYGTELDALLGPAQLSQHLATAREQLAYCGLSAVEATALLAPIEELVHNTSAWDGLDASLAIFVGPGFAQAYQLPVTLEPQCSVGNGFRLHPLLAALPTTDQFFILRVSPDDVRLLLADTTHTVELHSGVLPRGLDSDHYPTYLSHVGQALAMRLGEDETRPVVLACDATDAQHLRNSTSYPHVLPDVIPNDWTHGSDHQLHRAAKALVSPLLQERGEQLLREQYDVLLQATVDDDPHRIIDAAHQGRVHTLMVGPCPSVGDTVHASPTHVDHAIAAAARTHARILHVGVGTEPGRVHATVLPTS